MKIEERLIRRSPEDILHIGMIIENVMKGDFWTILNLLSASLRIEEIERSKTGIGQPLSSDRVLGRIEAYQSLIDSLEAITIQMNELRKPLESTKSKSDDGAEEIIDRDDVNEPMPLRYGGAL